MCNWQQDFTYEHENQNFSYEKPEDQKIIWNNKGQGSKESNEP